MTALKQEGSSRSLPPSEEEVEKVHQILDVMCEACDAQQALTFLRRNGGDVGKTLSALLDNAPDNTPTTSGTTDFSELRAAAAGVVTSHSPSGKHTFTSVSGTTPDVYQASAAATDKAPVIDLTGDEDDADLSRALKASLEDQGPTFGPSDRAPDPNWAVVPSNVSLHHTFQEINIDSLFSWR